MSNKVIRSLLLVGAALLIVSCVSPQTRIEKNPEGFAKLSPEQQALVKQGKVGIGFDEAAVKLALGEPDRVSERTDANGKSTIWRYVEYEGYDGGPYYGGFSGFYGRGFGSPYYGHYSPFFSFYPVYAVNDSRSERDQLRVVFVNGLVTAIEEEVK